MAVFAVRDTLRPSSAEAIAQLRNLGVRPVLLTGDNARAAAHVAAQVGIPQEDVRAEVLPGDKRDVVAQLQAEGHNVAMVGDGVNDAAALAQAGTEGLGFAMGTGTDVAIVRTCWQPWTRSGWRVGRWRSSSRTCSGLLPTTSPRSRWRPPGCSTP